MPGPPTDLGWYMDTNNSGQALGNGPHDGTFVKDIHKGIAGYLQTVSTSTWFAATRGNTFALGQAPDGSPAKVHPDAASAFGEIVSEIDNNRTLLISWTHWNITVAGHADLAGGGTGESTNGGTFYTFEATFNEDPWGNDETWNGENNDANLGHTVTAVGYIMAGDPDDPTAGGPIPTTSGTDWVIVHDNVFGTPRNVIVPFDFSVWVANTTVVPEPATLALLGAGGLLLMRRRNR